jgi:hypothetical protein
MTQSGNGPIVFTKKKYIVKDFYFYLYNTATGSSSWPKWPKCLKKYLLKKLLGGNNRARMDQFDYRGKKSTYKKCY